MTSRQPTELIAELATSDPSPDRRLVLIRVARDWTLFSLELIVGVHVGSHVRVNEDDLPRLDGRFADQIAEWRDEGHDVECYRGALGGAR